MRIFAAMISAGTSWAAAGSGGQDQHDAKIKAASALLRVCVHRPGVDKTHRQAGGRR